MAAKTIKCCMVVSLPCPDARHALHPLTGDMEGHWAVRVSGNWRLTFAFEGEDVILIDHQDYH
jgi:plasmid maintenance system killer protein